MKINKDLVRLTLTTLGIIGIPVTSIIAIKCHDKAKDIDDKKQKAKCYIPAAISGVAAGACMIGSHKISSKEIAALTATASFVVANRNKLEEEIKKVLPEQDVKKVSECADKRVIAEHRGQSVEYTGHGTLKCLEGYSGRIFYSSIEMVREAERRLNQRFQSGEYISMNDFYRLLGITETHFGDQWGWVPSEDWYPRWYADNPIGFDNTLVEDEDGSPLLVIDLIVYPMEGWKEC